ncbi:F-box domain-containing protein [Rhizopus microsporus]|uniref:F-box domain-containing protein n=1 Tax=Rhizopus microsporus TaxID=58291 RepID=A0A1X0RV23_RHIZD|nr:F-box domain-containing protein [Rhizopus microsporus]
MTRRKSVQLLVKKLSILSNHHHEKELVQEQCQKEPCREQPQTDILSSFPIEIILKIFSFLSFQDLVKVQLTCRLWYRLTQDSSLWKCRFQDLNARCTDIYAHNPTKLAETCSLSWHKRYCQAITLTNWRMGATQRVIKINKDDDSSRVLSVKLRDHLLVTLTENNVVKLYEYTSDNGFVFKLQWYFGDPSSTQNIVECIDVLPHIHILVIAQRGSRCMFFDINKGSNHDPIQVLKGGSHPWFIPDSIAVNQDYFAVAGRKPSAVFIWNWRKGIRLSSRVSIDCCRIHNIDFSNVSRHLIINLIVYFYQVITSSPSAQTDYCTFLIYLIAPSMQQLHTI